jgi:phosphoserine phosphatase RsbU/P
MEARKLGLSLKYKLLLLLTVIPVVSLSIYIVLATRLFENDKIAYVKDSGVAVARSLAVQFRLEVTGFIEKVKPVVESYDFSSQQFSETSRSLFAKQDRMDAVVLIQKSANGSYVRLGELRKDNSFAQKFFADDENINAIRESALRSEIYVTNTNFSDMHLVIATTVGDVKQVGHMVIIGLYRANDLYSAFIKPNIYQHYLLNHDGNILLGPSKSTVGGDVFAEVRKSILPEGAIDVNSKVPMIVSYAEAGLSGMKITAIVERKEALTAVNALLVHSILFFIALICFTVIVSVVASVQLTSSLGELYEATKMIAKGDFSIRIKSRSNDEIGGLAEGFNFMAGEVSRLIAETSEKARMAGELETVKLVQETLFPKTESTFGDYNIVGHFEPASECGGDWWYYSQVGDKIYIWIGDATGHGAPAAMVTSAAKSAASIIESIPNMTPGRALEILNKAIHETTKGRILMTFFIACLDLTKGEVTYANASHEPPYLIHTKNTEGPFTKKSLEPLIEASGPRLGDKVDAKYTEATVKMNKGDTILFYTDGVVDLMNKSGKAWGERGFIKSILDSAGAGKSVAPKIARLKSNISTYREATDLVDDITLVMCQYGESA